MKHNLLCRLNAIRDRLFRATKTKTHQAEQIGCGLCGRSGALTLFPLLDRRHSVDESTDDARRQCLMLDHWQMAAIS